MLVIFNNLRKYSVCVLALIKYKIKHAKEIPI